MGEIKKKCKKKKKMKWNIEKFRILTKNIKTNVKQK